MIAIDNTMSDVEQMDAALAASRLPEMPSADTGDPVVAEAVEAETVVADGTDAGNEDGSSEEDAEVGAKPNKNGYRLKIWHRDQEIAALKAQVQTLSVGGAKPADDSEPQPQQQSTEGKPTLAQCDGDLDNFSEALYDWKEQQKAATAKAKQQADTWNTRVSEAAKELEDFKDYAHVQIPLTSHMREFLVDSDLGPRIGYTLAKDLDEAQRIFGLPPNQQVKALTKLELQLTGTLPPPVLKQTKASAPPPIKPLAGGSTTSVVKDPRRSEMSFQEFVVWRNSGGK